MTAETIHETVDLIWRQALGLPVGGLATSWDHAGGDSLKALQLFLALEKQLGRKLDLILLRPDMTAGDLADAIVAYRDENEDKKPEIFVFPGLGGDNLRLAEFRRNIADVFHFKTITYPGLDKSADVISSSKAVLGFLADQVRTEHSSRAINFAAYSFGGAIAVATAGELQRRGHEIRSLIAIDCTMDEEITLPQEYRLLSKGTWKMTSWHMVYGLLRLALALRIFSAARRLSLWLRKKRGLHETVATDWIPLVPFRPRPNRPEKSCPKPLPVALLRAQIQANPEASSDLGWRRYARALNIIAIAGDHYSCLELPQMIQTCEAFKRAFFYFESQPDGRISQSEPGNAMD